MSTTRRRSMADKTNLSVTYDTSAELRLVLVGPKGSGKSATGNTLLGRRVFDEHPMGTSGDRQCHYATSVISGQSVLVVDTPALIDKDDQQKVNQTRISREIAKCLLLTAPGPHAILLIIRMTRLSSRLQRATKLIEEMFGTEANRYIIIILTGKDDLDHENETLDDFIANSPPYMSDILYKYPVITINNRCNSDNKTRQTKELIKTVAEHNNTYMTNTLYDSIEAILLRAEAESV